ncbi:MAG: acyl-CoA dehydrogenase [SAR116 cluster bacterium]|nr:MAG: acyl-CoA dehydrogenase [SAR116 cluster bacterium]HBQ22877.1 acyl-CoA dehydrogenase [Alphaproteobacteria bacterium]
MMEHDQIREAVLRMMAPFDDEYWRACDRDHRFPEEFRQAVVDAGWLGIAVPEAFGGSGLGVREGVVLMESIANSPGAMSAASSVHMDVFGPKAITHHGSDEQKAKYLPEIISGRLRTCFGVTEPGAGLDTGSITTEARQDGEDYVIHGQKIWTSTAQQADRVMLLARTSPRDEVSKSTDGLSLFFAPLDPKNVEIKEIPKMGRHAVNSNMVFYDGLRVSRGDLIGQEGEGFRILLSSLNSERCLIAAEAVGIGRQALKRACQYAQERSVFGQTIGAHQSIQHPLAESFAELEAAWLMVEKAADLHDEGKPCGIEANAAKYLSAEASFKACERAILTHGGMGYAQEYDVERLMREVWINRLAPISQQMVLNYIAERALKLPRSY